MKQIFDWMREQMHDRIKWFQTMDTTDVACDVAIKETERFIEYINEAEAKWEAEAEKAEKERKALQNRCRIFTNGVLCMDCPMECENRTMPFFGKKVE